jgi:hypothetical protein
MNKQNLNSVVKAGLTWWQRFVFRNEINGLYTHFQETSNLCGEIPLTCFCANGYCPPDSPEIQHSILVVLTSHCVIAEFARAEKLICWMGKDVLLLKRINELSFEVHYMFNEEYARTPQVMTFSHAISDLPLANRFIALTNALACGHAFGDLEAIANLFVGVNKLRPE